MISSIELRLLPARILEPFDGVWRHLQGLLECSGQSFKASHHKKSRILNSAVRNHFVLVFWVRRL